MNEKKRPIDYVASAVVLYCNLYFILCIFYRLLEKVSGVLTFNIDAVPIAILIAVVLVMVLIVCRVVSGSSNATIAVNLTILFCLLCACLTFIHLTHSDISISLIGVFTLLLFLLRVVHYTL